jgi:ABC-2 type transport system permease protein
MSGPLFRRTLAANAVRLGAALLGMVAWGLVLPVMYAAFGKDLALFLRQNPLLDQLAQFGGGDIFSLSGVIALGFVHPFTLLLMGIMALGFPALAVAGERQRGTLEVLLARPISRRSLYATLYAAGLIFLGLLLAGQLLAGAVGAILVGVGSELESDQLPLLWLNGWLLWVAFMSFAFAASVASDRIGPALGVPLVFVLVNYLANAIGSIWPDASWLQDWSMFDLVKAQDVLAGDLPASELTVLVAFTLACIAVALIVFPRRDLAAPS